VSPWAAPSLYTESIIGTEPGHSKDYVKLEKENRCLNSIPENNQREFPDHERSVDLVVTFPLDGSKHEIPFDRILSYPESTAHDHVLFMLPVSVRRKIFDHCFPAEDRLVSLSPRFATKQIFDVDHFALPWDILDPVWGGLRSFRELRHELMVYFWTEYHFYVALSPFSSPSFSPLQFTWLPDFLDIIQHFTVEIDFTRLGFSHLKNAIHFGQNTRKIEELFTNLVNGVQDRHTGLLMEEFNLMCRRYEGVRPFSRPYETIEEANEYKPGKATPLELRVPGY
jgi:hypothetical protein